MEFKTILPTVVDEFDAQLAETIARTSAADVPSDMSWRTWAVTELFGHGNHAFNPENMYREIPSRFRQTTDYEAVTTWHVDPVDGLSGYSVRPTQFLGGGVTIDDTLIEPHLYERLDGNVSVLPGFFDTEDGQAVIADGLDAGTLEPLDPIPPGHIIVTYHQTIHRAESLPDVPLDTIDEHAEPRLYISGFYDSNSFYA